MPVKHPDVTVQLTGEDGNAFFIIGRTIKALRSAGVANAEVDEFKADAMSGDYDHVLQTVMSWVETK